MLFRGRLFRPRFPRNSLTAARPEPSVCLNLRLHIKGTKICSENAKPEDLFSYRSQRWLWNEREQFQCRHLSFDLAALIRAAEKAIGSDASCSEVTKLPEGNFNKTLLVNMHDGRQIIARLPNPNAGCLHYTTASEVATMEYVMRY